MSALAPGDLEIVRHPRARRARLSVDPASGRVRLTLPRRMALACALRWAEDHRGWIERQRARLPEASPFAPGATIPFDDDVLTVDWVPERPRGIERQGNLLRCGGPAEGLSRRITAWLRREALAILSAETAEYAEKAGVTVSAVGVGDPKSRWGSCAATGAIRYSWRLVMAPRHVRRATVAHEVAHRVHMNHGSEFHALVAAIFEADPAPARRWLKTEGARLHWFGRES